MIFSTGISSIVRSQDKDGHRTVQFDIEQRIVFFGFYEHTFYFRVTAKAVQEDAIIQNTATLMGGYFQINMRWLLSDSKNGSEEGTLLEEKHISTAPLILTRISKRIAVAEHTMLLENIRKYFIEAQLTRHDSQ